MKPLKFALAFLTWWCAGEESQAQSHAEMPATPQQQQQPQQTPKELASLGDTALSKGDVKTALKYYGLLIRAEPTQLNFFKRGNVFFRKKDYPKAIEDFDSAINKDGKFVKAYVSRAQSFLLTGDCEKASEDYKHVLTLKAGQKEAVAGVPKAEQCAALIRIGKVLLDEKKDFFQAKQQFDEALKIAHESVSLLLLRAQANIEAQDFQSVLIDTRQALKIDTQNLEALLLRGNAYYRMGDYDIASQHYREGLRADPEHHGLKDSAKMLKKLLKTSQSGEESLRASQFKEAEKSFREALEIDPSNSNFQIKMYTKLCEALYKGGQAEQAIRICTQAIDLDNNNIDAYMRRADAKIEAQLFEEAIRDYTRATEIDGNNREAQDGLMKARKAEKMASRKDYYKILGIAKHASQQEIKKAFRKLALELHPDKIKGEEEKKIAEVKFRDVGESYEALSDPEKRAKYDNGEDIQIQQPQGNPFNHFFHQQQGGGQQFHFQWGG